jgi:uncharacterized protein (DUF433 family)
LHPTICREYKIMKEDVLACLRYATEVLAEEKVVEVSG